MADNRTMTQMLQAPIEGSEDAIVVPPINANNFELKQTLINLVQLNQFTGRQDPHNHLRFFNKQIAASLEDKLDICMNRFEKSLNDIKASFITPTAPIKAVEEVCVTCGAKHSYNHCPLTRGGNEFPVFHDNIQQFQTAAVGNFIQNHNQNVSNQMRPPGFYQPNQQNNQSRYQGNNFNSNQNRQNNQGAVYQNRPQQALNYQAPAQQNTKKLKLPTLNDTKMVLELADRTISKPTGVAENVFVKVGKFYFPADFIVLDFIADLHVPLIFNFRKLSTTHAIINVHEREIILRQDQPSLTIQCGDIPSIKKGQINKIDFIDAGGRDFDSEEIENFLNDDSIPLGVEDSPFNMEEDILFLEILLIEDPSPPYPIIPNQTESLIEEPKHSFNMGYEHFNTNLVTNNVAESSTKNLVPIPRECEGISDDGSKSIEPIKDDSSIFTTISNPLFDNDKINSDEINSHVESTSNHNTVKFDNLDEFSGPLIPIHIVEEERIRREHSEYINRMEMLFTINSRPHPATNIESFSSLPIPIQESDPHQDEIDHEFSESEDSDFDNPLVPLPPPEPPEKEFESDFGNEILVVRNTIVKFQCIDARVKFDVFNDENDDLSYFMLSAESEDTIFDP
nr:hypothetical protein [Tanacetum cinerariifolium]GEZ75308.1 hypothetical protein [Tanacetum cinerariifolium]